MNLSISVILPVYNRESMVSRAIDSALVQTHPPHEILVIDDGSADQTVSVCREYGNRIKLIEIAHAGKSVARNEGLRRAQGDFVAFLDSDDEYLPTHLAQLSQSAKSADIVYDCIREPYFSGSMPPLMPDGTGAIRHLECFRFGLPTSMVRLEFIRRCGAWFDPEFEIGEDLIFIGYLIARCARTKYVRKFGIDVGIHAENTTRDACRTCSEGQRALRRLREMLIACPSEPVTDWNLFLERGMRHMKIMRRLHKFRAATGIKQRRRIRSAIFAAAFQAHTPIRWQDRCRSILVAAWDIAGRHVGARYDRILFGYSGAARSSERFARSC